MESATATTEPFAVVRDHNGVLRAIRQRVDDLGTTLQALEARAGLQENYATKVLGKSPLRRASPFTLFLMLESWG
jgi:hypothetical protein